MKAGDYEGGRAVPPMFQQHQMLHQHPNHHKFQTRVFQKRELHPSGSDETKAVNQVNRIGSEAFMVSPLATSEPKKQKRGTSGGGGDDGTGSGSSGDGGTVEVVRRPRGRPPGSKNRPKPPLVVQQDEDTTNGMRAHILEIPAGHDVGEALAGFSRRHGTGLSVISGTGLVSNVAFRQPALSATSTVTFHGRYELLSISATFFPPSLSVPFPPAGGLSISLAGPQGQVVGGLVAGQLISAGTLYLVAAAFKDPAFHRLPEEEMPVAWSLSGDNSRDGGLGEDVEEDVGHLQYNHHGGSGGAAEQSSVLPMFSCNLPSDLGWGPSPRALRPSPY